jgi:hypothetical protein
VIIAERHEEKELMNHSRVWMKEFMDHGENLILQNKYFHFVNIFSHSGSSSDILLPPSELMTRSEAFRFAYWKHHREPTMRSIKKLEFGHDESHERLSKKRKEILSRIEASNRAKKELELRRRAERVMNHSLESMDDDSVEESDAESSFVQSNLPQLPSQDQDDHTAMSPLSVSNRRKGSRASMLSGVKREDTAKTILPPISSKRSTMIKRIDDSRGKENTNSAFSFLSEWGNVKKVKD